LPPLLAAFLESGEIDDGACGPDEERQEDGEDGVYDEGGGHKITRV
jgi:hypothetical protein